MNNKTIKKKKESNQNEFSLRWMWWCTPVVLATQEAEVEDDLNPEV
jgi:hypothetical protein